MIIHQNATDVRIDAMVNGLIAEDYWVRYCERVNDMGEAFMNLCLMDTAR